ncbi:MAG: ABC transporter ATP-binding protein, partial [Arachnia sp.]
MTENIITVEGLRRSYGSGDNRYEAVRGVDLTVGRGELYALLGTNGGGKTSLLEVIEGMAPATAGNVQVLGRDPFTDRAAVRPHTGIVLQDAGFPADITVTEIATTWARTLSRPRPVAEVLADVGLTQRTGVAVKSLSGGERRRLDLALALLGAPRVLFLDEPTTGLDPESRQRTWELIRSLIADGVTVVLTTHYLEEAEALADRIAILHEGVIVRAGTTAQ